MNKKLGEVNEIVLANETCVCVGQLTIIVHDLDLGGSLPPVAGSSAHLGLEADKAVWHIASQLSHQGKALLDLICVVVPDLEAFGDGEGASATTLGLSGRNYLRESFVGEIESWKNGYITTTS